MKNLELGTIIAERSLACSNPKKQVKVRIGTPRKTNSEDFITPYQIVGIGDEKVRFAAGLDAIQSLRLVFKMIGADISYRLKEHQLRWADGDDAGFPTD